MDNMQQPILDGIDPEIMERLVTRRDALRRGASMSGKLVAGLAMGSVPVALAALASDTFAQTPADMLDALRFAFLLENLENEFYRAVLGTSAVAAQNAAFATVRGQIPAAVRESLAQIQKHEQQHVDFIGAAIGQLGGAPVAITAADFDFTGGNGSGTGPFARAGTELDFLLLTAQAFEDTGVRAYKGQAGRFLIPGNPTADLMLESAVRIHSVEARHASKLRRIRRQRNPNDVVLRYAGYVVGGGAAAAGASGVADAPAEVVAALNLVYGGGTGPVSRPESNTQHVVFNGTAEVVIDAATLTGIEVIGSLNNQALAATMAFDEALTKEEVTTIVAPFIRNDPARGLP
ncbi:ferritin-like domain-containing protein [Longimicrobium sp.]|uniref:ferritin-like domain-containing protein n=1 Tax=Longimicrobium sp. TaxID=2029185 RepID=UPI003B3BC70D